MSTPSPQPLDYDLASPHAPKPARDPLPPLPADEKEAAPPAKPRPMAIESDNDARILDEIEASLRAMIAAERVPPQDDAEAPADGQPDEPATPTIDALQAVEAPTLVEDRLSQERRYYEAMRVQEVLQQVSKQLSQRSSQEQPTVAPEQPMEEYRSPPAFLARSMEPIRLDETDNEPWPKARAKAPSKPRSSATTLFVRFGFAAGGAAAVMMFALPDLRARFMDSIGTPLVTLSSNAAAVFGEGRPAPAKIESRMELAGKEAATTIMVRTEPVVLAREPNRFDAPMPKLASANPMPVLPEQPSAAFNENLPQQRETVMVPQRVAPETPNRPQPIWHGPPGRAEGENPTTGLAAGLATRPLSAEEIDLLRKMASDFIAAGDFAGARGVLERAAEAGDATSALQLATTYDPAALARFKVKGLMPDNAKAAFWYERARDLGSLEARGRLKAMARSN